MTDIKRLFLIDGSGYIHRAYHAVKGLKTSTGIPTNAVYGFVNMLRTLIERHKPDFIAVVFDVSRVSFRNEIFPAYKADRPPAPDDLVPQFGYIREIVKALNIPSYEMENYEADDLIATIAEKAKSKGIEVVIVSSDKDLFQLVGEGVMVFDPMKERFMGAAEVAEKTGVKPEQIADLLAILGDSSDNIPGVKGIGEKGAVELLKSYLSLEEIYANIDSIEEKKRRKLLDSKENAFLSKRLALLERSLPIGIEPERLVKGEPDRERLFDLFRKLEFEKFLRDFKNGMQERGKEAEKEEADFVVSTREKFLGMKQGFSSGMILCLYCNFTNGGRIAFVGVSSMDGDVFVLDGGLVGEATFFSEFTKWLNSGGFEVVLYDSKSFNKLCIEKGCETVKPSFDPLLAAYLLNPDRGKYSLETITLETTGTFINRESSDRVYDYAFKLMSGYGKVCDSLMKQIEERNQLTLLKELEIPLSEVLASMETRGVMVDAAVLKSLASRLDTMIHETENRIYAAAGVIFNINSPKQLAEVLFVRCGLAPKKKTKTGYSTDMAVLEELAEQGGSEIPALIIEQRTLQKLRSTYTDNLANMIRAETGRIHSKFNQTVTGTGRLSSSEPNLQNIPVRSDLGRGIRKAFIAPPGLVLMSADYSQIELRVLAHLSGDAHLIEAFCKGDDIHTRTAMEIFGIDREAVTPELRRAAKTINFGILYGMSAFRLGKDLKIDVRAAQEIIDRYFERLKGVKSYLDETVEFARKNGFVLTLFGRRRYIADINNSNKNIRAFAERTAINAPVQGSAADIIKIAMVKLHRALVSGGYESRIILQVHDELLLEVPEDEAEDTAELVRETMENAAQLVVPLIVDIRTGKNWDMK